VFVLSVTNICSAAQCVIGESEMHNFYYNNSNYNGLLFFFLQKLQMHVCSWHVTRVVTSPVLVWR